MREIFSTVCRDFGASLAEIDGEGDHVHLLVTYPPKLSVAGLVNSLKRIALYPRPKRTGFYGDY